MPNKIPRCPGGQADWGGISCRADQRHGGHHLPTGDHAGHLQSDHHDEHDHENEDDKKTSEMEQNCLIN